MTSLLRAAQPFTVGNITAGSVTFYLPGLNMPGEYFFETRHLDQMTGKYTEWMTATSLDPEMGQPFTILVPDLMNGTIHHGRYRFRRPDEERDLMSHEVSFRTLDAGRLNEMSALFHLVLL